MSSPRAQQETELKYESCSEFIVEDEIDLEEEVEKINEKFQPKCPSVSANLMRLFTPAGNGGLALQRKLLGKDSAFPEKNYYKGKSSVEHLQPLFNDNGAGLDEKIHDAVDYMKKHDLNYCVWNWGKKNVVLFTDPKDIEEILSDLNNLELKDSTGSFKRFFPGSIFTLDFYSDEYQTSRKEHMQILHTKLKNKIPIIQDIITKHNEKISENNYEIKDLENFVTSIAMEAISFSLMGIERINSSAKTKVTEIIRMCAAEVCKPYQQVFSQLFPWYESLEKNKWVNSNEKLEAFTKLGKEVLRKEFLEPNAEAIRGSKNWLNPKGDPNLDIYSEEVFSRLAEFLVVGHETTAKLLFYGLVMLANHPQEVEKLREELKLYGDPENFDETMKRMPRMEAFITEVLRLFPPLPNLFYGVKKDFSLSDGKRHLKAGDLMILSPEQTQKLKYVKREDQGREEIVPIWGDDAEEFNSDRHLIKNMDGTLKLDEKLNQPIYKAPLHCRQFTFGHRPKNCPGEDFARQEARLVFARIINDFDLTCWQKIANETKPFTHPTFQHIFTAIPVEKDIHMKFTPRTMRP